MGCAEESPIRVIIAVASGSNDSEVILTASYLRENKVDVIIASAEGWSPVTFLNGITIKPDCSLDRALLEQFHRGQFDVLLLPDGDDISIGRLTNHLKLRAAIKACCKDPYYVNRLKKLSFNELRLYNEKPHICIIASGNSLKILYGWGIITAAALTPNLFRNLYKNVHSWLFGRWLQGSEIVVHSEFKIDDSICDLIVCTSSIPGKANEAVKSCLSVVEYMLKCAKIDRSIKDNEIHRRSVFRSHSFNAINKRILSLFLTSRFLPKPIKLLLNTAVDVINRKEEMFTCDFESYKSQHVKSSPKLLKPSEIFGDTSLDVLNSASSALLHEVWNFTFNSLKMKATRRHSLTLAAILVTNRVDERLLTVLVTELRQHYGMLVHIIVCDKTLLHSKEPYFTSNRFFDIQSHAFLEHCSNYIYDVIVTIESDIYPIGNRIWCRNELFGVETHPVNMSCVSANFGQNVKKNPLNDEPINKFETRKRFQGYYGEIFEKQLRLLNKMKAQDTNKYSKFYQVLQGSNTVPYESMFRIFEALQVSSDMQMIVAERDTIKRATLFSRALAQCLELIMIKNGYPSKNISKNTLCLIQ